MTATRATARDALLLFVRAPERGRVKTRLAAAIGADAALRVYRRLGSHAAREARRLAPEVALRVHFTPAERLDEVAAWLGPDLLYLPQAEGDLGQRMEAAFDQAFTGGFGRVVIVGSDLPDLSADLLRRAFTLLAAHPAVLGPARDGGYWLLGLQARAPYLFRDMAWSRADVCARTVARLRAHGLEPALLPEMNDVDVAEDLPPGWVDAAQR